MKYLDIDEEELTQVGGIHTAREIAQQPEVWQEIWGNINLQKDSLGQFISKALVQSERIILTGAGTSAFIGLSLRGIVQRNTGIVTEAIATTDLVSHPNDYFLPKSPTLLISFARSGNSPESIAAINLADEICENCFHLIITCNENGKLADYQSDSPYFIFKLPPQCNDKSLAMTSSYTGMLLAGLIIMQIDQIDNLKHSVESIIQYGEFFLTHELGKVQEIANLGFTRAVFLGSGQFYGTAMESHLKLQELTDGKIICKNDSYLGFRHGPKAVINHQTLLIYFLSSSNCHAFKYEKDLIHSVKNGTQPLAEVSVSEIIENEFRFPFSISFSKNSKKVDDEFLAICYIMVAQTLGFYKSLKLNLRPDAPSANNDITRVVEGVDIYVLPSLAELV